MIFAILGVIILIISFTVALVSLIKEQNQLPRHDNEFEEPAKPEQKQPEEKKLDLDQANSFPQNTADSNQTTSMKRSNTGPFPWDEDFQAENTLEEKSGDQKKIDEIQAELAKIKSEDSLSGEFTLSEISKKSS